MQPGLSIIVLAGKPQIIDNRLYGNIRLSKWQIIRRPDHGSSAVGHALGRAQVVVVIIIDGAGTVKPGQGPAVQPDIAFDQVAQAVGFFDQPAVQVAVKDPVRRSMNSKPERYKSLYLRLFSNLFGKHSPDISSLEPTSDATHLEKTPFDGTLPSPIAGWMGS